MVSIPVLIDFDVGFQSIHEAPQLLREVGAVISKVRSRLYAKKSESLVVRESVCHFYKR